MHVTLLPLRQYGKYYPHVDTQYSVYHDRRDVWGVICAHGSLPIEHYPECFRFASYYLRGYQELALISP